MTDVSGSSGEVKWFYDTAISFLLIYGSGNVLSNTGTGVWGNTKSSIKIIKIEYGIKMITDYAFQYYYSSLKMIEISSTVTDILVEAFVHAGTVDRTGLCFTVVVNAEPAAAVFFRKEVQIKIGAVIAYQHFTGFRQNTLKFRVKLIQSDGHGTLGVI